jgi:hypothetical protein
MILLLAIAAAGLLAFVEWRRADRRHRLARIIASAFAVAALAAWGMQREHSEGASHRSSATAVLFTAGAGASPKSEVSPEYRFALAGVNAENVTVVPDVAYLRREYPEIDRLEIVGGGLEGFELKELRGMRLSFESPRAATTAPAIKFVDAPRELRRGDQVQIRGRVDGLREDAGARLVVVQPDGSETKGQIVSGSAPNFDISTPAPSAEGRFSWRIKLLWNDASGATISDETIGIAIVAPSLPRLLVLESSPNLETTHLQRWYAESGGAFASRTLVGEQRYRFAATPEAPNEFSMIDADLLARVDVLVIDLRSFAALTPAEADAIRNAVAAQGMGLLVLPRGETSSPPAGVELLPWAIKPAGDGGNELRSARLVWRGLTAPLDTSVALENVAVEPLTSDLLVTSSRGEPVASAIRRGRGEVALSLARDTWQWRLQDRSAEFAQYWSFLITRVAKPQTRDRWSVGGAPLVVHQPVELEYRTTEDAPRPGEVFAAQPDEHVTVPLAQDENEPQKWRTTYWPREAGWHRVIAPGSGAQLDFFVHASNEWQSARAEQRRAATEKFTVLAAEPLDATSAPTQPSPQTSNAWICFAIFLLSSGYLWLERRRAL